MGRYMISPAESEEGIFIANSTFSEFAFVETFFSYIPGIVSSRILSS